MHAWGVFGRGRGALAMAAVVIAGAAACGGDGNEAATATTPPSAVGEDAGTGSGASDDRPTTWDPADFEVDTSGLECTGEAPDPRRGVTDDAVRVGSLTTESGPTTALWGDAVAAARARFERTNAEGGVHGRAIEFVANEDDGLDANRSVDAARRLAGEVFAAVPVLSAVGAYADVFCEEVVPYVGWGFNPAFCNRAVGFGFNGCLVPAGDVEYPSSIATNFREILGDNQTLAVIGNEDAAARQGMDKLISAFERGGLDVVAELPVLPAGQPLVDASPFVQQLQAEDPGGVYLVSDFSNTLAMVQALKAAGYDGAIVAVVGYDPRLAALADFDNVYTTLSWQPFENTEVEFVQQMNADFDQYAPEIPKSLPAAAGYIAADFFVAALEAAGPDLTVDSFLRTLNGGEFTYNPPEFFGGSFWPESHLLGTPCGLMMQTVDGAYQIAAPLVCAEG